MSCPSLPTTVPLPSRVEHAGLAYWRWCVGVDTAGVEIDRQRFRSAAILTRWASYLQPFYVGSPTFGQ